MARTADFGSAHLGSNPGPPTRRRSMNSRDFCYWLQGFFEMRESSAPITEKQAEMIKNHLNLVFKHEIDGLYEAKPEDKQLLQEIHDGSKKNPIFGPNLKPEYVPHQFDPNAKARC